MRRRVEVLAFAKKRVALRLAGTDCPVCSSPTDLLTTRQAAAVAQVDARSVRRWLAAGSAHGMRTPGGQHRVCRNSLFVAADPAARTGSVGPDDLTAPDAGPNHSTE